MTRWIIGCAVLTLLMLSAVVRAHGDVWVLDTQISPLNGHTYHLLSPSPWTDAEMLAISLGGHLATINDHEEELWVWNTFAEPSGTHYARNLWIGLSDAGHQGVFTWANGEPFNYSNWAPNQPSGLANISDPTSIEDYVQMGYYGHTVPYSWNDLRGDISEWLVPLQGVAEVIPEPSTFVLLSLGALAVVGYVWRRRRAA